MSANINSQTLSSSASSTTSTLTVTTDAIHTPFSCINHPFYHAIHEAHSNQRSFQKGDINVDIYNTAITAFLTIFDALGSPIITEIVRRDFRAKTNGLRNSARRLRAHTLRQLVVNELKSPPRFWAPSGIQSLLWSQRILHFIQRMVQLLVDDAQRELKEACIMAYRETLALRHPHMTKVIFERALQLVPPRKQFLTNLCDSECLSDEDIKLCLVGMEDFLNATRPHTSALATLFEMEQIEDPPR
ncbi:Glycolipid transfer protein [Gracilariopsis chorda]|uniref:Glycolipid transfer protein n=1 Tax=Gracilariopsis chorda TaxID=448386 RepID=A0A2V3J3W8_9FLOR|nr:Glycolipid transfer protein [Gracilariopsis chorda]|eukprot:PXF49074.1 Glycolipid transfer protein [Gracilariopsis chorda]